MTWVIHNHHTPAVVVDEAGAFGLGGKSRLRTYLPRSIADTRKQAEAWRTTRQSGPRTRREASNDFIMAAGGAAVTLTTAVLHVMAGGHHFQSAVDHRGRAEVRQRIPALIEHGRPGRTLRGSSG